MAIDMCSESPNLGTSPRISFSHDLHHTDHDHDVSNENYPCRLDSSLVLDSDFNFCVGGDGIQSTEPSSADELFSGGLIRPLQIQQRFVTTSKHISISKPKSVVGNLQPLLPLPTPSNVNDEASNSKQESESKPQSNTFWRIKRSSSLHCDNSYKKSSFWSTLPQLLRSNSTGSVPNSKLTSKDSHHHKQNSHKQNRFSAATSSSSSSSSSSSASVNVYSFSQKPPLKKNYGGSYGNGGVRISPVLNVPPPYISRGTTNLFGLGSLFRNRKDHKKNKK